MNRTILSAAFLSILSMTSVACAGAPGADDTDASEDGLAGATHAARTCGFEERAPYLTAQERDERTQKFNFRNGGGWMFPALSAVDGIRGAIRHAQRTALSAPRPVTPGEALVIAEAFVRRNTDLLDVTEAEIERGEFKPSSLDGPLAVKFYENHVVPGTEGYDRPLQRFTNILLVVGRDGAVEIVRGGSSGEALATTLCAKPASDPTDDLMLREVLGTDLVFQAFEFVPTTPPQPVGRVTRADIRQSRPTLHESYEETARVRRVAWRLDVERGGHRWDFIVDAVTGARLALEPRG